MEAMKTVSQKIEELKNTGYKEDFYFEDGKLKAGGSAYGASEVEIEKEFRFEGKSNPDDLSIVYQIAAKDGTKGTIVDGFGPTANQELAQFLLKADS
ncbi:hypothetical protein GCM10027429_14190 [Marivirga atlantica]|uniref:Phosphoribosylpyrophosphate synthetase n=1 Tax=Marivirga atlantica TaxID=1548457 RepID=A0A937DJB4_9BACT|nr:hypothetical protein [Marivirga atlantica]MBL0765036.1 hypothetical protein [Marivirga atlantica]